MHSTGHKSALDPKQIDFEDYFWLPRKPTMRVGEVSRHMNMSDDQVVNFLDAGIFEGVSKSLPKSPVDPGKTTRTHRVVLTASVARYIHEQRSNPT